MPNRFVGHLADHYERREYRVVRFWEEGTPPSGWRGPPPDLYAEKGARRIAFLVEPAAGLSDADTLHRCRSVLLNEGVQVRLYTRRRRSTRHARTFLRGLPPPLRPRVLILQRRVTGGPMAALLVAVREIGLHWQAAILVLAAGFVLILLAQWTDAFPLAGAYVVQTFEMWVASLARLLRF